jgi:hypothetical protein
MGDARMEKHTADMGPVDSWLCTLLEHVADCSITSCRAVQSSVAIDEPQKVRCVLYSAIANIFRLKKDKRTVIRNGRLSPTINDFDDMFLLVSLWFCTFFQTGLQPSSPL